MRCQRWQAISLQKANGPSRGRLGVVQDENPAANRTDVDARMRYSKPPKERIWLTGVAVVVRRCECQARLRLRGKTAEASQHVLLPNRESPFVHTHQTPHQQAVPTLDPAFTVAVLLNR
jgi:hypothetical protein